MVTADVHIAESILDDPITIDSYLSEDILQDSSPPNSPHEVNMEIDISDNEAEMLISENIDDDLRIVVDKTGTQEITISNKEQGSRILTNTTSHETNFQVIEQIQNLFITPPHEVDALAANTLADNIRPQKGDKELKYIATDIRKLYPLNSPLGIWELILMYSNLMKVSLRDNLIAVYGRTDPNVTTFGGNDIRQEDPNRIQIFSYNVSPYLLTSYREYNRGNRQRLPQPPRDWRRIFLKETSPTNPVRSTEVTTTSSDTTSATAGLYSSKLMSQANSNLDRHKLKLDLTSNADTSAVDSKEDFQYELKLDTSKFQELSLIPDSDTSVIDNAEDYDLRLNRDTSQFKSNRKSPRQDFSRNSTFVKFSDYHDNTDSTKSVMVDIISIAEKIRELQDAATKLTEAYTTEFTSIMEDLAHHRDVVAKLTMRAEELTANYDSDCNSINRQLADQKRKLAEPTMSSSSGRSRAMAPYKSYSRGKEAARSSAPPRNTAPSGSRKPPPQNTTPIEDPLVRMRQRMQQSAIGVLTGTQAKSLAGTEALRKSTSSGVLREIQCRKVSLPVTTNMPLTSGINLFKVANWDHAALYEALPDVAPTYMGKSWTPENTAFDVSTLHLANLKRDVKIQLAPMLLQNLDTVVSSTEQYSNALTRLALDVEA